MPSLSPRLCPARSLVRVFIIAASHAQIVAPSFAVGPKATNAPIEFARQRLTDPDEWIRSIALDVVASLNPQAERERLREALDDPSAEVRWTAIFHLKKMPLGKDSAKIRSILDKASKAVESTLRKDPHVVDSFLILEFEAVEALLATGSGVDRQFAKDYVRVALNDQRSLTRWEIMAELVPEYRLHELASLLRKPGPPKGGEILAARNLAKLGDQESIMFLRKSLNDEGSLHFIISDAELVKILGLKREDIAPHLKGDWFYLRVAAATALARLGDSDGLHDLMGQLLSGDLDGDRFSVLIAVGDAGDESFLPSLAEYFESIEDERANDIQWKLQVARAIALIRARQSKEAD